MTDADRCDPPLPVGSEGKLSGGWWGVLALIVTEGSLFGYLLFAYFYLASQTEQDWPPEGVAHPPHAGREYSYSARQQCFCLDQRTLHPGKTETWEHSRNGAGNRPWRLFHYYSAH